MSPNRRQPAPHDRRRVLILGAHGRFGLAATQAFAAAGWDVLAQVRRDAAALPAGVQALNLPLANTAALVQAAAGSSAVVYAVNPAYTRWPQELLPLARLGMDAAERLGARLLLPGNVYNHGRQMPALLTPETPDPPAMPPGADTRKGALRRALEAELAERAAAGRLRSTVLRAGDFYGAGRGSWLDLAIAKDLRRGQLVYPGPLDRAHAWAYLPDLARALVAVAGHDELPAHARLHFPGHTLTGAQFIDALQAAAARAGLAPAQGWRPLRSLPWGLLRAGAWLVPMWRELAEMAYLWEVPHALDGRALEAAVGVLPATPVGRALEQSLLDLGWCAQRPAQTVTT